MPRLFFGCPVPPLDSLRRLAASLRGVPGLGRVEPEPNWHVTVKFLGQVPDERVASLIEVARLVAAGTSAASVPLARVGVFPSRERPRVFWVGSPAAEVLAELAAGLEVACAGLGWPRETRPFAPHVTLLRLRPPVPAEFWDLCDAWSATQFGWLDVPELWLYESQPDRPGAGYRVLQRFPLAQPS